MTGDSSSVVDWFYGIVWLERGGKMSTLYESLCVNQRERIRLERETKKCCQELALSIISGIGEELAAPDNMFGLVQPAPRPGGVIPPAIDFPKSVGFLAWGFRFAFSLTHPNHDIVMGTYSGDFTIRRQAEARSRQWGVLEWGDSKYELNYPTQEISVIRQLASELAEDVSNLLLTNRAAKVCQIGFKENNEE
jgi:hypothetical protein